MRRSIHLLLLFFCLSFAMISVSYGGLGLFSSGFRGVEWGSAVNDEYVYLKQDPNNFDYYYARKDRKPVYFYNKPAEALIYVFGFENRLYKVVLKFDKNIVFDQMLKNLNAEMGSSREIGNLVFRWESDSVLMDYFSRGQEGSYLMIVSKKEVERNLQTIDSIEKALDSSEQRTAPNPLDKLKLK